MPRLNIRAVYRNSCRLAGATFDENGFVRMIKPSDIDSMR